MNLFAFGGDKRLGVGWDWCSDAKPSGKKQKGASVSSHRSDSRNASKLSSARNRLRVRSTAGLVAGCAAAALLIGLATPASALSSGQPQDLRPVGTVPASPSKPVNVQRPVRPQATAATTTTTASTPIIARAPSKQVA